MWEVAVSKGVCPGRSWMSLKERFSKTILKRKGIAFFVSAAAAGPSSSSASSPEKAPQQATRTFQPNAYTHEQVRNIFLFPVLEILNLSKEVS